MNNRLSITGLIAVGLASFVAAYATWTQPSYAIGAQEVLEIDCGTKRFDTTIFPPNSCALDETVVYPDPFDAANSAPLDNQDFVDQIEDNYPEFDWRCKHEVCDIYPPGCERQYYYSRSLSTGPAVVTAVPVPGGTGYYARTCYSSLYRWKRCTDCFEL